MWARQGQGIVRGWIHRHRETEPESQGKEREPAEEQSVCAGDKHRSCVSTPICKEAQDTSPEILGEKEG